MDWTLGIAYNDIMSGNWPPPNMETRTMRITTCHILKCPTGRYTFAGRVPESLCRITEASRNAIMGGRAYPHPSTGRMIEAKPMVFETEQEARGFARLQGVTIAD